MSIVKGLKTIEAVMNKKSFDSSGPKTRWLRLDDGQSAKIRFANELDEDSPNFDEGRNLAIVVREHQNPKDYKRKAVCMMEEEGRDWAEEMHRKDPKAGWGGRNRFYVNVLVDDGMEDPYIAVWSQGLGKQSAVHTLLEYTSDTGSISNLTWKIKRQGTGTDTTLTFQQQQEHLPHLAPQTLTGNSRVGGTPAPHHNHYDRRKHVLTTTRSHTLQSNGRRCYATRIH